MSAPALERRLGLLPATALNMSNMIGIGPFITIPLLMSALGGPQALLGWLVALVIVIADGLVWSELGAALPGSGGTYRYLREGFGAERWGRLMAFLFIWQFILSGPLEIASGYIGFARYVRYIWPGLGPWETILVAMAVGVLNIVLLYRRITAIGGLTVSLWIGTLLTTLAVIVTGALNFDAARAFDFPPGAFNFSLGFLIGLGAASRVGIYDYLGYYDVCYIGDEVKDPGRVIPRSILISVVVVALIYIGINLSIIGVVPWREFVPYEAHPHSDFIVSTFMERVYGPGVATFFTLFVLWAAFGSVFAILLGYSRIPYAAARDGTFFAVFGRLHPTKHFPHVSLVSIGVIAMVCCALPLGVVIDALITTRILVQFMGQIVALALLRRNQPQLVRPFKMWLYPLPSLIAFFGWLFLFTTSGRNIIAFGLGTLLLGIVAFGVWARGTRTWPFAPISPAATRAMLILLSVGAAALAIPTPISAQMPNPRSFDLTAFAGTSAGGGSEGAGLATGLAVGYNFTTRRALELELMLAHNLEQDTDAPEPDSVRSDVFGFSGGAVYHIRTTTLAVPYLTAGIGVARTSRGETESQPGGTTTSLLSGFGGGLKIELTGRFFLRTDVRFLALSGDPPNFWRAYAGLTVRLDR